MEVLKISSTSRPASVAGAIASTLATQNKVTLQAVGAGAINQAVKAIAIARGYITPLGYDLSVIPAFTAVLVNGIFASAVDVTTVLYQKGIPLSSVF